MRVDMDSSISIIPSHSHLKLFHLFMFLIVFPFQPNKGSKKAKKSGSNIFSLFSQKQIQEFKEAFGIIDNDKDGIITAPDLKKAFEVSFKDMASFINKKKNRAISPWLLHNHRPGFTRQYGNHGLLVMPEKTNFLGHLLARLLDKGTKSNGTPSPTKQTAPFQ